MPRKQTESLLYHILIALLLFSTSGIWPLTHVFYISPLAVVYLWVINDKPKIQIDRSIIPFILLFFLGLISLIDFDYNSLKKTYFVFVYVWIFLFFDFSRTEIDFRKLTICFIVVLLIRLIITKDLSSNLQFEILDSKSSFESTLAFPLGMLALFFFLRKDYLWFGIASIVSFLALKRVVIIALILSIIVHFIPKRFRQYILNPFTITFIIAVSMVVLINFAQGNYDEFILENTGYAANHFSKGRQHFWSQAISAAGYTFEDFLFHGIGFGKVVTSLQKIYNVDKILLHNDYLTIILESGYLVFLLFTYLLNWQKHQSQRTLALFLSVLFLTDNVIIYQHVMVTYLLLNSYFRKIERIDSLSISQT